MSGPAWAGEVQPRHFVPARFGLLLVRLGAFPGCLLLYSLVQRAVTPRYSFETSLDRAIPFVPWMIVAYLAFFPFVAMVPLLLSARKLAVGLLACAFAISVAWPIFLLAPASMTRPDPTVIENALLRDVFTWLHVIDDTHNTFPSLHVAIAWICALGAARWLRHGGWAVPVAVGISASTMLVKQHLVVDVVGGTVLGAVSFLLAERTFAWWDARPRAG